MVESEFVELPGRHLGHQTSAVSIVLNYIREGMREGRLVPGQRLIEPDLISTLQVSRGTVREALTRLQGEGLVEFERFRGARIRILSRATVIELNQIREVVEGLAARLAATRIDDEGRRKLIAAHLPLEQALQNYSQYNENFHNVIVELSQNKSLTPFISATLLETFRLQFSKTLSVWEVTQRSHDEHTDIVNAILEKNAQLAESRMITHIRSSSQTIMQAPDHYFSK